jgi:hypothetical protein
MWKNFVFYDSVGWLDDYSGGQWLIRSGSKCRGWPFVHSCWQPDQEFSIPDWVKQLSEQSGFGHWLRMNATYDLLIAVAMVVALFIAVEVVIRRRDSRKMTSMVIQRRKSKAER